MGVSGFRISTRFGCSAGAAAAGGGAADGVTLGAVDGGVLATGAGAAALGGVITEGLAARAGLLVGEGPRGGAGCSKLVAAGWPLTGGCSA